MSANNDSYVPLQQLYNSGRYTLQILVRKGTPNLASRDSDVPIRVSRIVSLLPGQTLRVEPNRIDEAQLQRHNISTSRTVSIGVMPSTTPIEYMFNGTFYLECLSPVGLPADNQERSMFGWVKPAKSPNGQQALFGYGPVDASSPYNHNMLVYNWDGNRDVELWGSSAYYRSQGQNTLIADRWNFVGISCNGTTLTTYVNGLSWSVPAYSLNTISEIFRVGFAMTNSLFIGDIKSISVWDAGKSRSLAETLRKLGPVDFNGVPSEVIYSLTDCIVTQNSYKTVALDVVTPPGAAEALEASSVKEYTIGNIQAVQSDYATGYITVPTEGGTSNMTIMSKDYELAMLRTSSNETISGSSGGDAFYTSSQTMVPTLLEYSSRTSEPVQNIEVYHDGSLSSLSSRTADNVPVFSLSARIKDTPVSSQLTISDNSVLRFSSGSIDNGLISYWNLSEIGNTNLDSVANNDLVRIAI